MAIRKGSSKDRIPPKTLLQKEEQRIRTEEIEKGLSAIYRDDKGDVPDLTTFEAGRSRWRLYLLGGLASFVCLIIVAAWVGFTWFRPFHGFSGQGFLIQVDGPERVALGQEITYLINYQNKTSEPLASAEVRVSFPSDFVVKSVEPMPTQPEELTWRLGSLPLQGQGTLTVHGVFTGALGTATAIQVVGTYRPASFNSDFEALATKVLNYRDSVLNGSVHVPVKVLPGDRVAIQYELLNNGEEVLHGLVAHIALPEGFQRESTSSSALDGRMISFSIADITPHASTTISVYGTFASGVSGEAHVVAEAGRVAGDGAFFAYQHTETSFNVLAGDLALHIVMNGQTGDQVITYGIPLHLALAYENTASEDVKDIRLHLLFEPAVTSTGKSVPNLIDWGTLQDEAKGVKKNNTVSWTKDQIPVLSRLPSHQDGSIDVSVNALQSASGTPGLAVKVTLVADISLVGDTKVDRTVRSTPIILRYLTDAFIQAEARYYSEEGAPLGSGPMPPVVGKPTMYRIQWSLAKRFHELKNISVSAKLPASVRWVNHPLVDAGSIAFNDATRIVTWTLNRLPANVRSATGQFDVELIPTISDANHFASLLGETTVRATDAVVNQGISPTSPALTTDLRNDQTAQGKGVVRME